jgi:protein-S-isoprenylcysteine O-methyltransferase Ste14
LRARAARGSPERGAVTTESRKPQLFAWVGGLFLAAAFVAGQFLRWEGLPALRYAAPACALAGLLFAWIPMFTLRRHGRAPAGKSYMHATVVVERGPFALVRHPQYLGYMLFAVTAAAISRHWVVLVLSAAAVFAFHAHSLREERDCLRRFGEAYARYMERVPRFNVFRGALGALRARARPS